MNAPRRWVGSAGVLAGSCALVLGGCGTPAADGPPAIYGGLSLPRDVGIIGLTVARPAPEFALELPETKLGAARSVAAAGARDMARDPYAAMFFPFGYVLGGVVGGLLGVSEGDLQAATRSISAAVQSCPVDTRIAQMVLDRLEADHPGRIRRLADNVSLEPGAVHGRMRHDDRHRVSWTRPPPPPHPLAGTGIDVVVGLRVTNLGFRARTDPRIHSSGDMEKINPTLALVISADIVAVQVRDWADAGGSTFRYESPPRTFTAWADDNARPLRQELETALREIQRQIARQFAGPRAKLPEIGT
ncbi:MAG TPA: hypothetical protein VL200_15515 [Lacunisphaera sp.]|nr:hypothetical protein [Lacunisphaera sp.]